jgi:hypothetical protein
MIDDHGTCTHGKAVTWKKTAAERSSTVERILDCSMLDKWTTRSDFKRSTQKLLCSEKGVPAWKKEETWVDCFYTQVSRKPGNIRDRSGNGRGAPLPMQTDFREISGKGQEPIGTKWDTMRTSSCAWETHINLSGSRTRSNLNGLNILSLTRTRSNYSSYYNTVTMSNVKVYEEKEEGGRVTRKSSPRRDSASGKSWFYLLTLNVT